MEIVEVTETEYPIVQQIAYSTWPGTFKEILSEKQIDYMLKMMYSLEAMKNQVDNLRHKYILAKDGQDFLGYVSYETDYKPGITKVHKIYVLPDIQGKGVGKFLIEEVATIARKSNNHTLSLNVNRFNKAIRFYEHMGFHIQGSKDIDIGDGFLMEDYIMDREL